MPQKKILLLEGKDDIIVCKRLIELHNVSEKIEYVDSEGVDKLIESFEPQILGSEVEQIGVVIDADDKLTNRWEALTNTLKKLGYSGSFSAPEPDGTIFNRTRRPATVGIWIMPNNKLPGMLEDFVSYLVPDKTTNPLWALAGNSLVEAQAINQKIPSAKGHIHTFLAWQDEPGKPLGLAITKGYLNPTSPEVQNFLKWINLLFVPL